MLGVAATRSGRRAHLLEKDAWVVWTLGVLFRAPFEHALVFKGGTSLSKAYRAIGRFSEDVDLTYDIRTIAADLAPSSSEWLPSTRSQEQRWTRLIRERLSDWTRDVVAPLLVQRLQANVSMLRSALTSTPCRLPTTVRRPVPATCLRWCSSSLAPARPASRTTARLPAMRRHTFLTCCFQRPPRLSCVPHVLGDGTRLPAATTPR